MPGGPKGEKRPGDVIGAAVMVARIATGEIEGAKGRTPNRAKGGKSGGKARGEIPWAADAGERRGDAQRSTRRVTPNAAKGRAGRERVQRAERRRVGFLPTELIETRLGQNN